MESTGKFLRSTQGDAAECPDLPRVTRIAHSAQGPPDHTTIAARFPTNGRRAASSLPGVTRTQARRPTYQGGASRRWPRIDSVRSGLMKRPRVTIYNEISLDGRIEGFDQDVGRYYRLGFRWRSDAILMGSVT